MFALTLFDGRSVPSGFCRAEGILRNVNTMEEYKNIDRLAIIEGAGRTVRFLLRCEGVFS